MIQRTFDYDGQSSLTDRQEPVDEVGARWDEDLDTETRAFVQQKTDEIHGQMKRTAEGIIKIGRNLIAVKTQLRGRYEGWLKAEFAMSLWTANKFVQVATRFGEQSVNFTDLSVSILYALAAPSTSDEVVDKVLTGEIEASLSAIKAEKEAEKRRADDAEQARAEIARQLQGLIEEVTTLQCQLEERPQVTVENPETKAELARLQEKYAAIEAQLKQKTERVKVLSEEIRLHDSSNQQERYNEQIRFKWRQACDAFHLGINQAITRMVTPLDAASAFEANDWARLAEVESTINQALEALKGLRESARSQFVEGSVQH